MTAKEYLSSVQILRDKIQRKSQRIMELYNQASGLKAISYDKISVQVSASDPLPDNVAKILDAAHSLENDITLYIKEINEVTEQIEDLAVDEKTRKYANILYDRYINSLGLAEIAYKYGYHPDNIRHEHGRALIAFAVKYNLDIKIQHKKAHNSTK